MSQDARAMVYSLKTGDAMVLEYDGATWIALIVWCDAADIEMRVLWYETNRMHTDNVQAQSRQSRSDLLKAFLMLEETQLKCEVLRA